MTGTGHVQPASAALSLRDVSVSFGASDGLSCISFDVERGERLVLVGPSGAGKTTLLRAIAGLVPVTSGTIAIGGVDRTRELPERRDAVYLHQTPLLFPHLDVFGNIAFPLRVRGVDPGEVRTRVNRAMQAVQLEGFGSRRPNSLSGGQRHRVALARAIVARPAVLLLDEPLSSLDPALRNDVRETIVDAQTESGAALLLVTHDLDEAGLVSDRIGVIVDRRLAQTAAPSVLFTRPASLAIARLVGIGNEITGDIDPNGVFVSRLGAVQLGMGEGVRGPAVLVFRPDAVRIDSASPFHGTVARLLHRAGHTTALVDVNGITIEIVIDALSPPETGDHISLELDPRRVIAFSTG
ncbi:MAG: ABC transporter ATP-binding protein [Gemmatimonadaceae bacterium]